MASNSFGYLLFFRRELRAALSRISHIKYKEFEADFGKKLLEAEKRAEGIPLENIRTVGPSQNAEYRRKDPASLSWVAEISPRVAITEAWLEVERAVTEAAKQFAIIEYERRTPYKLMSEFERHEILTENELDTFTKLSTLRDEAVYAPNFSIDASEAQRYVEVANKLASFIRQKAKEMPQK